MTGQTMFVDGSYVSKVAAKCGVKRFCYIKLRQAVGRACSMPIDEAYYFDAPIPRSNSQVFYNALQYPYPQGPGFRVVLGRMVKTKLHAMGGKVLIDTATNQPYEVWRQKEVDTALALHMYKAFLRRGACAMALVAGDADFLPVVRELVLDHGVQVTLVGRQGFMAVELMALATRVIDLGHVLKQAALPSARPTAS